MDRCADMVLCGASVVTTPTGWDVAGVIGGGVAVLGAIGAGLRWMITRGDRREAALIDRLVQRVDELEAKEAQRDKEVVALRIAFEIVAGVVRRTDPTNAELARAEAILAEAFPPDFRTPADMLAALSRLK